MPIPDGVYYPVITPFTEQGEVDEEALSQLLEFGIDGDVDGIFALGSSGQGPAMNPDERKKAMEILVDIVDDRVPVVGHVGTPVATTSVSLAQHAASVGVDMLALLPPYFYSDHNENEVTAHYKRVAETVDCDIMIYNNPKYAGTDLTPERVRDLVEEVPSVSGIKASFTTLSTLQDYVAMTPDSFKVFAGSIGLLFPTRYHGVSGSIHPPSSVFPELAKAFWEAIEAKDVATAVTYQDLLHEISKIIQKYSENYGRAVYSSIFRQRGIDIDKYPLWEHQQVPKSEAQNLYEELKALAQRYEEFQFDLTLD